MRAHASIELTPDERLTLQVMRACSPGLPYCDLSGRLTKAGLVGEDGLLTKLGRLAADATLSEEEENAT